MPAPYRAPGELPRPLEIPSEFVYHAAAHERRHAALRKTAGWMWAAGVAIVLTFTIAPSVGVWVAPILLLAIGYAWRRGRRPEKIVLLVEGGELRIASETLSEHRPLESLLQVELETKAIAKSYADKVVGTAIVSMAVMPEYDASRIVLVFDDDVRLVLGTEFEPSSEVTAWLGRLRVFLRKHHWIPVDERD